MTGEGWEIEGTDCPSVSKQKGAKSWAKRSFHINKIKHKTLLVEIQDCVLFLPWPCCLLTFSFVLLSFKMYLKEINFISMYLCFTQSPRNPSPMVHALKINSPLRFPFDGISSKCFKTARHHLIITLHLPLCKTLYVIMWLPSEGGKCDYFPLSSRVFYFYVYNRKSQSNYINPKVLTAVKSNDGDQDRVKRRENGG